MAFAPDLAEDHDGFNDEHFAQLAEVEAGNFLFWSLNRLLVWAPHQYFPSSRNFLDLGWGTGFILSGIQREFSVLSLSGQDIFIEGFQYAEKSCLVKLNE